MVSDSVPTPGVGRPVAVGMWTLVPIVAGITYLAHQPWIAATIYAAVIALTITALAAIDELGG